MKNNPKIIYPQRHDRDHGGYPYRLKRTDSRNIALQRQDPGGRWRVIAYCGNRPASIANAVTEMVVSHWTPDEADDLATQLNELRRVIALSEETQLKNLLHGTC